MFWNAFELAIEINYRKRKEADEYLQQIWKINDFMHMRIVANKISIGKLENSKNSTRPPSSQTLHIMASNGYF